MSKIPEDIRATAEGCICRGLHDSVYRSTLIQYIAEALMAERERCAKRFMTATDLLAEGNQGLSIEQITFIADAIRP